MELSRKKSLAGNFRSLLAIMFILLGYNSYSQYNPAVAGTTSNKPYAPAQANPTDSRSYYYDAVNFTWRPYQSTSEVLFYLNLAKYRTGQFDIVVNSGGTLSGGLITGGVNTIYYFKNGTADSNLVVKISSAVDPSLYLQKANNLSDVASIPGTKTTLGLNNVDNTSDATKWAATATLTNKTISGSNNTFSNIPNSALNNSTIGFTFGTSGSDFNFSGSPTPLGGSVSMNFPFASTSTNGKLSATDWNTFNNKLSNITGLITQGSNVTITGSGTGGSPYVINSSGSGGSAGSVDSIKHLFVDTGVIARNLYTLAFDSINRKWILTAPGTGGGSGITSLNGLTNAIQTFATGTAGTDFGISSSGSTHTFNFPSSSASNRGLLTSADWTTFNGKQSALNGTGYIKFSGTTPSYQTPTQVTADLNLFTSSLQGLTPASAGGTTNFLRADGTWAAPPSGFADPLTTNGDIIARISGTTTRLAQGSNNTFLGVQSGTLGYYAPFSLTTTGSSGAATFSAGVLNIPQYSAGFVDPMTTAGDMIGRNSSNVSARIPAAPHNGMKLTSVTAGLPVWQDTAVVGGAQGLQSVLSVNRTLTTADSIIQSGKQFYIKGGQSKFDTVVSVYQYYGPPGSDSTYRTYADANGNLYLQKRQAGTYNTVEITSTWLDVVVPDSVYMTGGTLTAYGDSYTTGVGASGPSFYYINQYGLLIPAGTINNYAVSGSVTMDTQYQEYSHYGTAGQANRFPTTVNIGFNDITKTHNTPATQNMLPWAWTAVIAHHFLATQAAGNDAAITKTGTWSAFDLHTSWPTAGYYFPVSGRIVTNANAGSTLTWSYNGDNVVICFLGANGTSQQSGRLQVKIDGVIRDTINEAGIADSQTVFAMGSSRLQDFVSAAKVYYSTSSGSHTIVLTTLDNISTNLDYLGTMDLPNNCKGLIQGEIQKLTTTGYSNQGGAYPKTNSTIDSSNAALETTVNVFRQHGYPCVYARVNDFTNPNTDLAADQIHPNDAGHTKTAQSFNFRTRH